MGQIDRIQKARDKYCDYTDEWERNFKIFRKVIEESVPKHLEPQKKAEVCEHIWKFSCWEYFCEKCKNHIDERDWNKSEPQQEDKKIEMVEFKYMDMNSYNTPNSIVWNLREIEKKINEIITYLNNREESCFIFNISNAR